jgi:peroxiredoxin
MTRLLHAALGLAIVFGVVAADEPAKTEPTVKVGAKAPEFKFKDQSGKTIDLAELFAKGPVLVRLTCGCSGCDKELAYFQQIHNAYKDQGLQSLFVFKEPDAKMVKYAQDKKLNMIYAVDPKGASWTTFQTKAMPSNFLIEKGGKIIAITAGCDPSGLLANNVSKKAAAVVGGEVVDVKSKVEDKSKK